MCAGALVVATLTMGAMRKTVVTQDVHVSGFDAEVIARENARSALNMAVTFVVPNFASLVSGANVSTDGLARGVNAPRTLVLAQAGMVYDLLPQQSVTSGGTLSAKVQRTADGRLEVVAEGRVPVSQADGAVSDKVVTLRRVYGNTTPLDAALSIVAPAMVPTFGDGITIDGRDTDPTSLVPTNRAGFDRNGIRTNAVVVSERAGAVLQGMGRQNRVQGVGGTGDIVTGNFALNLDALFEEAYQHPSKQLVGAAIGARTFGSAGSPAVVVAPSGLIVDGVVKGTGVLVVNGDLKVSAAGQLLWDGLVMVRRDGSSNLNLTFDPGGPASQITGGMVVLQGSSSFVMPFDGRVKVTYLGSAAAWFWASAGIEHRLGNTFVRQDIVPRGANRSGDVVQPYLADLRRGQQVGFYIGVYFADGFDSSLDGKEIYRNYARGYFSQVSGKPYGSTRLMAPYTWRMGFEDLCEDTRCDPWGNSSPDYDYDDDSIVDQAIRVTLQCKQYDGGGAVVMSGGQPQYEDCTPQNPDVSNTPDLPLDWATLTSSSGIVSSPPPGSVLNLNLGNARIYHSATSIGQIAPLLQNLRDNSRVTLIDSWASK